MEFSKNIPNFRLPIAEPNAQLQTPIFHYGLIVWRRRISVLAAISAALCLALVYITAAPARYTATTTVALDARRLPFAQNETLPDLLDYDSTTQSQVETIKSTNVASIVLKKLKLTEDREFGGPMTLLEKLAGGLVTDETADPHEQALRLAIERFEKALHVSRTGPRSYVVEISYTSADAKKAAMIANATAEAYIEDQIQAKFETASRAAKWLQQRISELRTQATNAFKTIQDFKSQNNLIVNSDGKLETELELEEMADSLAKARAETALAQSRLAEIEAVLASPSSDDGVPDATVTDALNSTVITKLRQQYLDDKNRANEWASRYGQMHQAVINLRSDMAGIKRAIREEMQRIAETYKSDLKVARARVEAISKNLIEVFQNNSGKRQSQAKLQELETAANSYRSIYETFLSRYTQAVQQQSFPSTEARVISPATPGKKTSPKIVFALALALAGGGVLGIATALVRERMDRVIYSKDQLVREMGATCIAVLPAADHRNSQIKKGFGSSGAKALYEALPKEILRSEKAAGVPTLLYQSEKPFSAISEALLNIKVAADIGSISRETRALAMVSALPGEGKSSIASSLAAAIAGSARKVFLIDCDLRNPSLTRFFGMENRAGLLELLQGLGSIESCVNRIDQYGFDFLCAPSKVPPVHTADLLNSEAMNGLLASAKERYDYLIIDLPPVIPVSDVRACAHLFDAFAFVVEWGKTSVDDLNEAMQIAPGVRDRLLGFVLNKVDAKFMRQAKGYGYKYGHYAR